MFPRRLRLAKLICLGDGLRELETIVIQIATRSRVASLIVEVWTVCSLLGKIINLRPVTQSAEGESQRHACLRHLSLPSSHFYTRSAERNIETGDGRRSRETREHKNILTAIMKKQIKTQCIPCVVHSFFVRTALAHSYGARLVTCVQINSYLRAEAESLLT